jgi:hypothetical protein
MSQDVISELINSTTRLYSDNKAYMLLNTKLHSYIFRFKDMESVCKIFHINIPNAFFSGYGDSYILKFKDVESIEIVLKCNRELPLPEYNLDYNTEEEIIVDGHVLKIVYLFNSPFSKLNDAFIIDAETRKALVTVDNKNGNYINYALADILGTQKYIDKDWYSVNKHPDYEVPELLTPVITKCQLLIDFSMR